MLYSKLFCCGYKKKTQMKVLEKENKRGQWMERDSGGKETYIKSFIKEIKTAPFLFIVSARNMVKTLSLRLTCIGRVIQLLWDITQFSH